MPKFRFNLILERDRARWTAALLIYVAATVIRMLLEPLVHERLPLLPYLPALAAVGLTSGVLPGLALFAMSALTLAVAWHADVVELMMFAVAGGVALGLSSAAHIMVRNARVLKAQLQAEIQRKDTFLATLAHELRNPMAPIRYAARLLDGPDGERHRVYAAGVITRQSTHMARLLDDLLDMSRVTRNKVELVREVLDLREAIHQALDAARGSAERAGHRLASGLPDGPVWVSADSTRLNQILGNLIDNAIKYTPASGLVQVELMVSAAGQAQVRVSDNGLGLSPEMRPRVFELFTQLHRDGVATHSGLGIGLAVVRQLALQHGGEVSVESAGLGQGCTFTVSLPVVPAPAAAMPVQAEDTGESRVEDRLEDRLDVSAGAVTTAVAGAATRAVTLAVTEEARARRHVLIVDDNQDGADLLAIYLSDGETDVSVAYTGSDALAAFEARQPDVVVLDLGLPDASGLDVARAMRQRQTGSPVRLVALTGWGHEGDRARSADAGFDVHLVKPVSPSALQEVLLGLH